MFDKRVVVVMVAAVAMFFLLMPPYVPPEDADDEPDYQAPDLMDEAEGLFDEVVDSVTSTTINETNVEAFLWTIRVSEGTDNLNGYSMLVGGGLFNGFDDHPRVLVSLPNLGIKSSAAGAYQILRRTWDEVRVRIGATDFSPAWQDRAAIELIRRRGALADVRAGRFAAAIEKCKREWASLPGAGYGQHENTLARLQTAYTNAGGMLA